MLEKVRDTGLPHLFVAGPDPVERLHADRRRLRHLEDDQRETVVELEALRSCEIEGAERAGGHGEERR